MNSVTGLVLYKGLFAGDGGHEQLISNGAAFKPAFAERDNKQEMIDLRGIMLDFLCNLTRHLDSWIVFFALFCFDGASGYHLPNLL
jgi:hypothetical protein